MKQSTYNPIRLLSLDYDRQLARVRILRRNSNVVRLRFIPWRLMRHLATFQGVNF